MKVLAIAATELRRFTRDRANFFFVFILPIGIILLIGSAFGQPQGPKIGIHAGEGAGAVGAAIVERLSAQEDLRIARYDTRAALVDAVERGTIAVGVDVPDDLEQRLVAGEVVPAELIAPLGGSTGQYQALLAGAIAEVTARESAIRFVMAQGADRAAATAAVDRVEDSRVSISVTGREEGESLFAGVTSTFAIGATSQIVLFMFVTGLAGSAALIQSRRYGIIRRMLGTPTGPGTIIGGETLGRFTVVLVQGLYILAATALFFGTAWGDPLGAAAVILVFSAIAAAASMLLGTLFNNDQQASTIGVIFGLGLGALGGCMLPLELFSPTLNTVAHFTPHAWALDAFAALTRREATIVDILPQLAVLLGFAIVLLALAAWRMRGTLGRSA